MAAKSRDFVDEYDEGQNDANMSDAELEALLSGHLDPLSSTPAGTSQEEIEPGTEVRGRVVDFRGGEILVELDSKTMGVVDETEYVGDLPQIGDIVDAKWERFDAGREVAILTVREAVQRVLWEEIRVGGQVEGVVTATNKGGLTVDVKGVRAFLPISQIERERVEDASDYIGQRIVCEVTQVERESKNLVLSRRVILEREAEEVKGRALARLSVGEKLTGRVVKIVDHLGAFIDLGGVEGLLHESRIHRHRAELGEARELQKGQEIEVEITNVDEERGRVGLDFHRVAADSWKTAIEGIQPGDEATGWVTRTDASGVWVAIDEGVEGLLPRARLGAMSEPPSRGSILRVVVRTVDANERTIELDLAEGVSE